jgi:predicted transcriptional regulator
MEVMTLSPEIQSLIQQEMATGLYADEQQVISAALKTLREEREMLAGIDRGLADSAAGRGKTIADFDRDFRARHGIGDDKISPEVEQAVRDLLADSGHVSADELLLDALKAWVDQQESRRAIQEGFDDIAAGRTQSFEEFDREFRRRHGISE